MLSVLPSIACSIGSFVVSYLCIHTHIDGVDLENRMDVYGAAKESTSE